jgi:hypothetical protein
MHKLSLGILSAAFIATCSAATAQMITCSRLKAECDKGVASRGEQAVSQCPAAFKHCLKAGVWHTSGTDGRTIKDVSRK